MPGDPILRDLRTVSDETLYARLALHRQRFPEKEPEVDYPYRCEVWGMVNRAVRSEIQRRGQHWRIPRQRSLPAALRRPVVPIAIYLVALAIVGVLSGLIGH